MEQGADVGETPDQMPDRLFGAVVEPPDFVVVAGHDRVDAWSVRRLPFEPKGSMLSLRDELRSAIDGLDADSGGSLRAVYSTASIDFCDAENVLLYNVGPSRFSRLATQRLSFERSSVVPACSAHLSGPPLHHHCYTADRDPEFVHWTVDDVISSGRASIPSRTDKPADWWWQIRLGSRADSRSLSLGHAFGLRLRLRAQSTSIPAVLKPMLDGIIAALQSDPSPSEEAVTRLADHLRLEPDVVRGHLRSPGALRGPLVRAYRTGLQWNPVDDLCTACTVEQVSDDAHREIHWELFAVSPRST